jgi:uncharacterized phage protein (TIGR01671 family)
MNREIKFRAWDAEQNKMIETFDCEYQIHVNKEDGSLYCGGYMPNGDWNEPPLMQYTGLKDKNGKEIYEGDIVTNLHGNKYVIEWDDDLVGWNVGNNISHSRYVIGNIYDTPDLLNSKTS